MDAFQRSRYISEFVGTFVLVACVKFLSANGGDNAAIGIGLTLMVMVYNLGHISGAHLNPAVTVAMIIRSPESFQNTNVIQWLLYLVMQFTGGICGGLFSCLAGGKGVCGQYTFVRSTVEVQQAFFAEAFFTFLLATMVLHVASDKRLDGNQFYGVAIGTVLLIGALSIGSMTGCAINPAVFIGTVASAASVLTQNEMHFDNSWIYIVAELLGGVLAGGLYVVVYGGADANGKKAGFELASEREVDDVDEEQEMIQNNDLDEEVQA